MGVTSAARAAEQMSWTFRVLRFGLMVGIGGGVPSAEDDVRLGDVVVSMPTGSTGGVI
jgi:nucleoside phosphorylase